MTAIQEHVGVRGQAPLHAQSSTLAEAQSRFMETVSECVEELMRRCGYGRERAISALLRELGRGDASPNNDQVFDTMTAFGLGVDDAVQALTVSRAVQRVMKERAMSAVEAIDDLSSKLSITKLLASGVEEEPNEHELPSRPCSPEQRMPATPTTSTSDRHSNHPRKGRKVNAKPVLKIVKQKTSKGTNSKNQNRKRPCPTAPTNEEGKPGETLKFSSRARASSVTDEVEAKAKKARIASPEEA